MKSIKKALSLLCIMLMLISVLSACEKKQASNENAQQQQSEQQQVQEQKKVEIAFWEQDEANARQVLDNLIAEFQSQNPNITIKRTHFETEDLRKNFTSASLGTTGPDIVLGPNDNLGVFVPGNLVQPTEDIMGEDFFKNFDQVALAAAKYYGKQYMIPDRNGNELCLLYNKKLVPEAPKTFEELISISKKLQSEKKVQYGLAFNKVEPFFTVPFLGAFGGQVFDDVNSQSPKATLDTPAMLEWAKFLVKLQNDKIIPKEADYDVASNLFKEGKVAFLINGPWEFGTYVKAGMDLGICPIPSINGRYPAPYSAVKGYCISASVTDPDKKAAVKKFLEFVNSKDAQLKMVDAHKQLPTNIEALQDSKITSDPMIAAQKAQLEKCIPMPIITQMRAVWDAMKPVQQELFAGKIKPEDAPKKMQQKAEEGIKALGF
ncbi:extracellular solute-binding protein [Caloramator sp. E03]|uniref:sugar ABC transporter substrate-binding protein n=1 Tax=Caloramator sp. E03 TaxID=2576307 RepID=UPI0011100A76|nr:extracellular solute-binding protein [Caloramator sp. E03]QCX33027.1 extracellular solute-binding protein [Caloramator sp. E03]